MKDEKKKKFIQVFALALIMLLIASSTYAYFAAKIGDASSTDITVTTSTVDNLTFETGDAISIYATQDNFGSGTGNQSGSTYASATLIANNDTNEASANYYLYIKIDTNEFEYTTSDKTAELILTITDPDGNEVTSLSGLTYTSVTDGESNVVSGFDITTAEGLITIVEDYLIEYTASNTQEWNITVTLVNLGSDQSANAGANFSASLLIQSNIYGNTLQAYKSNSKIWAYTSNTTKIVFDDSGGDINDYYCYFNGEIVYGNGFGNEGLSPDYVTESSCNTVYKITDNDFIEYYDDSLFEYIEEYGVAVWDANDNVCKTSYGEEEVVSWYYGNSIVEDDCSGTVYYDNYSNKLFLGVENVGNGEWKLTTVDTYEEVFDISNAGDDSILAYVVDNGDGITYTIYIVSELPIICNDNMSYWFSDFVMLENIDGLTKLITSNVIDMSYMFFYSYSLTLLDLSSFDTSNVITMEAMFAYCYSLTSLDLSSFDTSNVNSMNSMFMGNDNYFPDSVYSMALEEIIFGDNWNTSNVEDMSYMFRTCYNLTSLDLSGWDTSNVTDISWMFAHCDNLIELDLSSWNTSKVTDMSFFLGGTEGCKKLIKITFGAGWDTSNVTDMSAMFAYCSNLTELDLSSWNTSNVTSMYYMFLGCYGLTSLNLSNFDTSNVETMSLMFAYCYNLNSLDLSNWDTSNVADMSYMFDDCSSLTSLDLSMFDTSNVTDMSYMFQGCSSLTTLNLSNATFTAVSLCDYMFEDASSSITIIVKDSSAYDFITARLSEHNGGTVVIA